jgi:hypothetical protein
MVAQLGTGWGSLCEELDAQLRALDPPGQVLGLGFDSSGLPRFRLKLDAKLNADGRELVREYESRAHELCETCGGPGRVRAGVIVTVRCDHCA